MAGDSAVGLDRPKGRAVKWARLAAAGLVTLCALLASSSCASAYFYNKAVARRPKTFIGQSRDIDVEEFKGDPQDTQGWLARMRIEKVSIESQDGLRLVGHYVASERPCGRTAILAHGYSAYGLTMAELAQYYREELGYDVLMPDARGHGESEGKYIGFGWHDRLDYLRWVQWVIDRSGPEVQIVLHGISMGGATVLMTSGEELPPQVKAVVSDCAYTSAEDELRYLLERMYRLKGAALVRRTSKLTLRRVGWTFEEASALEQVRMAALPILFIHGGADTFVPREMVDRLYAACASEKELLIVPDAGHGLSWRTDQGAYVAALEAFLGRHID